MNMDSNSETWKVLIVIFPLSDKNEDVGGGGCVEVRRGDDLKNEADFFNYRSS